MMGITAEELVRHFLDTIKGARAAYEKGVADEQYFHDETNDLNHALELLPRNHPLRIGLDEQLSESRWQRRKAKDEIEQLEPLINFLKRQKGMVGELSKVLGDIKSIQKEQSQRFYTVRVRKDLGERFEHRERETVSKVAGAINIRRRRVRCNLM
ncbi:hypothetical protein [Paenibacillus zanthoxyli]|uniref:hypothetical protein n=1 Tax=Paenibacillus zanthoxyli TaxID=369399 RepID=UPI0004B1E36B|nr:hypothetical protein [Paenibacillus zanthoxyli]